MDLKFERHWVNEETVQYFVNGKPVAYATHDEHGWSGMDVIKRMFERIAQELGVEVEETEGEEK